MKKRVLMALLATLLLYAGLAGDRFVPQPGSHDGAPRVGSLEVGGQAIIGSHIEIELCEDTGALDALRGGLPW